MIDYTLNRDELYQTFYSKVKSFRERVKEGIVSASATFEQRVENLYYALGDLVGGFNPRERLSNARTALEHRVNQVNAALYDFMGVLQGSEFAYAGVVNEPVYSDRVSVPSVVSMAKSNNRTGASHKAKYQSGRSEEEEGRKNQRISKRTRARRTQSAAEARDAVAKRLRDKKRRGETLNDQDRADASRYRIKIN